MKLIRPSVVAATPFALFLLAGLSAGCAGPDLVMANPLTAGQVPQNVVTRQHGYAEGGRGLPVGSMADQAIIDAADAQQVCVKVQLHELSAIDLANAEIKFTSNTGAAAVPLIAAEPPSQKTYNGLVPKTTQTGTRLVCNSDASGKTVCETQPITTTTMVPGPVDVFATGGRICAPNQSLLTATTTKLTLDVRVPSAGRSAWGVGHATKSDTFRWEFH